MRDLTDNERFEMANTMAIICEEYTLGEIISLGNEFIKEDSLSLDILTNTPNEAISYIYDRLVEEYLRLSDDELLSCYSSFLGE